VVFRWTPRNHEGLLMRGLRGLTAAVCVAAAAAILSSCSSTQFNQLGTSPAAAPPPQPQATIGTGKIRVGLILPLSAPGNAGVAAQSMKNAAQMALDEFKNPNIQLLVKDDAGNPQSAQAAAQQALNEGAEIIVGPLFAQAVRAVGTVTRQHNVPVIAFSTDSSVASPGVYLLSFLPETDVKRIVDYQIGRGRRSFAALLPDNAYGSVAQAAFQQEVSRRGGRILAIEKYSNNPASLAQAAKRVAQVARRVDSLFIPDNGDSVAKVAQALTADRVNLHRLQLLGTGLWEDQAVFSDKLLQGGLYAAPQTTGFRNFAKRYRARFGQEPVRTATLSYDAVALIAALVKTQGVQRFSPQILTNQSGFAGIDGIFRFRRDGTNDRGLAVMRVTPSGGQVVSPSPSSFKPGT
jgi:branched-chain amino acid transport system substrate-binding protein